MPRLHLVRHAHARSGWGDELDPPLDKTGLIQAQEVGIRLAPLAPILLITSPLLRARGTAAALEDRWHTAAIVEPVIGEVPSPTEKPDERKAWLAAALASTWTDLGPRYQSWRTMVTAFLLKLEEDAVIVTHFVAINAAVGVATGDDRVWCTSVGNAGVVVLDSDHEQLVVVDDPEEHSGHDPGPVL